MNEISDTNIIVSGDENGGLELEMDSILDADELSPQQKILPRTARGFFGIGIENSKTAMNLGTLWRSANLFGAAFIFTVGKRYAKQCSDTMATPRHIPLYSYADFDHFYDSMPYNCPLVGVELMTDSIALPDFNHPERAIYLLGAEDHGLSKASLSKCHELVQIPSVGSYSLNVAVAGSIVMFDRIAKQITK